MIITLKDIEIYIEQYTVQNIQNTLFSCLDNCAGREWHPVPRREDVARQRLCPVGSWCRGWGAGASQGSGSAQTSTTHGTNALCPPPLFHPTRNQTWLHGTVGNSCWVVGYLAPGKTNPLCESFCGQYVLFH